MHYYLFLSDCIEIIFYSTLIYFFCLFLKTDKTKPLLVYFLSYCTLILVAWSLELPTITPFLYAYAPIALILFIVIHEKTLQRNFVALRTITPAKPLQEDWLDLLLSSALAALNNNKSISIVIENRDALDYFLQMPFFINAPLSKDMLTLLLSSSSYEEHKIVWVTCHGYIRGINATWHTQENKNNALFYSLQCDAIIIHSNQFTRSFTLIYNGIQIDDIPAHDIKHRIKKQLLHKAIPRKKGASHDETHSSQKHHLQ
jgi:hypothetical protein